MIVSNNNMDPRIHRTKALITESLIQLIDEKGFEKVTVKDIAEKSTVNRATFYLHFRDKYDLIHQCIEHIFSEIQKGIIIAPNIYDFFSNKPHPNFVHIFETVRKHKYLFNVLLVKERNNLFTSGLMNIFHELVAVGLDQFEPDDSNLNAPREIIIKIYEATFLEVIIWWIENDFKYSSDYMAKILLTTILKGPYQQLPLERNSLKTE